MITSITLLVVVVVVIGCCSAQSLNVSLGKSCKVGLEFSHSTYGGCRIYGARDTYGRLCEMEAECTSHAKLTDKTEVCPKHNKMVKYTKWEVDFVDVPNNYVCITRHRKFSMKAISVCFTYFVCFYDQVDANQKWWCVFGMKVNDYQQSTQNSINFKTIEIKIDNRPDYSICPPTTLLALTKSDGNETSVISYRNSTENITDTILINALMTKLDDCCSIEEPSTKGCKWSNWTDVSGCERRFNNPTSTCNKTRVRIQISQGPDIQPNECNGTEVKSIECTKEEDVLTGCDLDCTMSEWTTQPCSPNQLPNGRLSCKRNLTRTIQINQAGNGAGCGELSKQEECKINDSDVIECLTECKLSSWSSWTKCNGSDDHGVQESQKKRTREVMSEEWVPMDQRFKGMMCNNFHLEETKVCVGSTDKITVVATTSEQHRQSIKPTTQSTNSQLKKNITQKTLCFELEDKEITEIELHYAASISEEAGTSGLGPVAAQEVRAKCAEYGQKIIFSLHQKNISLLADNVVHLLIRIKIIDTENGRQRKKRSAALKKKLAGHLQQMFDSNPVIIKFNNNEEATLKGKPSRGEDRMQARCYGWMIGLGSVAVALFLVGMVAILVAVEPWKRGSARQVAVQVDGQGAMAGGTGEVVDEEEGESVSM